MISLRGFLYGFIAISALFSGVFGGTAYAANASKAARRVLSIDAPAQVGAGVTVAVPVVVRTEAGGGEKIGFLHGEYSVDGGSTWTAFCYEQNIEASALRNAHITAGPAGSTIMVRVRVAFRNGVAGDVDHTGAAIRWDDTWKNWRETAAKLAVIRVGAK